MHERREGNLSLLRRSTLIEHVRRQDGQVHVVKVPVSSKSPIRSDAGELLHLRVIELGALRERGDRLVSGIVNAMLPTPTSELKPDHLEQLDRRFLEGRDTSAGVGTKQKG